MKRPKISIIVPCYNVEKYLDRCIMSLLNQTLLEIEVILVDDQSPDKVPQMIDGYAKKDDRIKAIHKKNEGLGFARNTGLDNAVGEYIAFVDSDDYVDVNMYLRLYNEAVTESADAVFCGVQKEITPARFIKIQSFKERKLLKGKECLDYAKGMIASPQGETKERLYMMSVWHSIYKSDIIKKNNIRFRSEREVVCEDLPFQLKFLSHAQNTVVVPNCYYFYCLNQKSLSSTFLLEKFDKFKELRKCLFLENEMDSDMAFRINRCFVGFSRIYIQDLVVSKTNRKMDVLKKVINDNIWDEISKNFPYRHLPIAQKIFHYLVIKQHVVLLYTYAYLFYRINRVIKVCRQLFCK